MIISGKDIASQIIESLKLEVGELKAKDIIPTLAVILIGDDKSSVAYIRQKELKVKEIGANIQIFRFDKSVNADEIKALIKKLDGDVNVHGIILQRPTPEGINAEKLEDFISPEKEVDGFGSNPIFPVPVAEAALIMLEDVFGKLNITQLFSDWLKTKRMTILGTGETAGQPIINYFRTYGIQPTIITSATANKDSLIKTADIIISAVGKIIINSSNIKKGAILIGVGMHTENGKLLGDYNEDEIKNIAAFYSPTPGGVGPVNVAMLLKNLIEAAEPLT